MGAQFLTYIGGQKHSSTEDRSDNESSDDENTFIQEFSHDEYHDEINDSNNIFNLEEKEELIVNPPEYHEDNFYDFALRPSVIESNDDGDKLDHTKILDHNDLNDYVTSSFDLDISDAESDDEFNVDPIPSTNTGDIAYEVEAITENR
eukprot:10017320-Ditylum_brightwellii.AAC.1